MIEFIKTKLPVTYANIYDDLWFNSFLFTFVGVLNILFVLFLINLNLEYVNYYAFSSFSLILTIFTLKYFYYKNNADNFCKQLFDSYSANNEKLEIQMITKSKISSGKTSRYSETKSFFIAVKTQSITFEISCNRRFDRTKIQKELLAYFNDSIYLPSKEVIVY